MSTALDALDWVLTACRNLGLDASAGSDDFFHIGGSSLTAIRLIDRAEAEFGEDALTADGVFEHSALSEIAAQLSAAVAASGDPDGVTT